MAYEIRDNSGSLFRNEDQSKSEYSGNVKVGGVDYWINGWVKETKDGRKYFSLSFKEKGQRPPKPEPREQSWDKELDDEIPW